MAEYEEKILISLVEKYRKSKKDNKTNKIARRTKIIPTELYRYYNRNDGDMEKIEALNQAAEQCCEKGFLTYETEGFSSEIRALYLVDDKVEEIERYLEETCQYESKTAKQRYVMQMLETYSGRSPAADRECEKLRAALAKNRIPAKYQQTEMLLKALVFIENNQTELFLREASMMIYGDSKYLGDNMLNLVCTALRDSRERPCAENELEDEILEEYRIVREKQKICLKGDVVVRIAGRELELGAFADGVEFFDEQLKQLEWVRVRTPQFMTVENQTSWFRLQKSETTLMYLGGYATRSQRDFLKKVCADNPGLFFWHFGDIDAGGLYIHEHLCRVTGIPFEMYRMSRQELEDERYKSCLHPLTNQDRIRLNSLRKQEKYRELAEYMVKQNAKLEQEIVSYYECFES